MRETTRAPRLALTSLLGYGFLGWGKPVNANPNRLRGGLNLPIPPLDGSKLLLAADIPLPLYRELANFGFVLLIVAMSLTQLGYWISAGSWWGMHQIFQLLQFVQRH